MKSKLLAVLLAVLCVVAVWCNKKWNIEEWNWFFVGQDMCENAWWSVQQWQEWWEYQDFCLYDDGSYCYLESLYNGSCDKWEFYDFEHEYEYDGTYNSLEQICIDNAGQVSQTEEWEDICILNDNEFCYMNEMLDGWCNISYVEYGEIDAELAVCDAEWEDIVCWKDWNSYFNRCYMDFAWVEEETELAEVVDGECVYG